jgi:acyl carrier protein
VFHIAGVIEDGLLVNQDAARFERVFAPKVLGAWNLHLATRDLALDHFVMYSSAAAMFGTPGLGNYVAANAFLDALAHHRQRLGLPALSIGWGAFAGVGMDQKAERRSTGGVDDFTAPAGAVLFRQLLGMAAPHLGVVALDARQWLELNPVAARSARFSGLLDARGARRPGGARRSELLAALGKAATEADRIALLTTFVGGEVAAVLRMDPTQLPADAPLKSLGLDSVMGLELRNRLESGLGLALPATLVWTYPTVAALAEHLAGELSQAQAEPRAPDPETMSPPPPAPAPPPTPTTDDELLSAFDASLSRMENKRR